MLMTTVIRSFFIISSSIILILILWISNVNSSAVLIADYEMTRMIELAAKQPFCRVHTDRGDIQRMLLAADPRRIRQVPRDSVISLENVCHDTGGTLEEFQGGLGFIYPGTKWCGPGNLAADYSDLGKYADEDRCCREHDLCPNTLAPGECRRGLCNTGTFTRSHCDCDARFRRCLQSLNSEIANTLGAVFFNVVQVTCFRERSPCSVWQRSGYTITNYNDNDNDDGDYNDAASSSVSSIATINNNNNCPFVFQPSEFYLPPNNNFISKIINASANSLTSPTSLVARKLDLLHGNYYLNTNKKSEFEQISSRLGVKLASLGLVATNLVKEMVSWPIKDIFHFIQKVHERHMMISDEKSLSHGNLIIQT